ncbi:MFS transporter [Aureimonas sp. D3]|uniref:MFS transporter n=1 Tax=Aureimonas sp. D3 TaxID=1638164 RepID=UPI0007830964|nr:MFS transporter [Aureimonas sp. D3]
MSTLEVQAISGRHENHLGIAFINAGSLMAQIVQIAGFPTLLALVLARLGYPSWLIGAVIASQWFAVLVLAPFVPRLIQRFGLRWSAQAGTTLSIVAILFILIPGSLVVTTLSALLMGAGLTIRWVVCDTWIVRAARENERGRAIGIHETLMGLGLALGPLATMATQNYETAAIAIYGILLLVAVGCFVQGPNVDEADGQDEDMRSSVPHVLWLMPLALLAALAAGYIETAMVSLMPLYLLGFHYPEASALTMLSVFGFGGTLLQVPLGWIADRWGFRSAQLLCVGTIIVGGLLIVLSIGSPWHLGCILFVWGGCVGGLNTLAVIEAGSTLRPAMAGTGMALIASSYTLGGVLGPIVSGSVLNLLEGHGAIVIIICLVSIYGLVLCASPRPPITSAQD